MPAFTPGTTTPATILWHGGPGQVDISCASWNGATAALQVAKPDGSGNFTPVDNASFSADGVAVVTLKPGPLKLAITGTPLANVYASVWPLRRT